MKIRNTIAAGLIAASATFGVATATAAETTATDDTVAVAPATTDGSSGSSFGEGSSTVGNVGSSEKLDALSSEINVDSITGVINTLGSLAQSIIGLVTAIVG